jgi:mRNA-degrading endonuclease RelE of RelBE toxin-antitoxin system
MWKTKFQKKSEKKFSKLDRQIQERIRVFVRTKLEVNPHYNQPFLLVKQTLQGQGLEIIA